MKRLVDVLFQFDQQMLDRFEKFCHKTQRVTGWTNFTWARAINLLLVISLFGTVLCIKQINPRELAWAYGLLSFLLILIYAVGMNLIKYLEKDVLKHLQEKCANPERINPLSKIIRLTSWLMVIEGVALGYAMSFSLPLAAACLFIANFSIGSFFYFLACTPLPPCDSKLKQWLQSLFLAPALIRSDD